MKQFSALTLFILLFGAVTATAQTDSNSNNVLLSAPQRDSVAFEQYAARRGQAQAIKDSVASFQQPAKINYAKEVPQKGGSNLKNSAIKPNTSALKLKQVEKLIREEPVILMQSSNPVDRKKDFR